LDNERLTNIVKDFFEKNPPPYFSFDYGIFIPSRKLNYARKFYAPYDIEKEYPILLIDDTFLRSAKKGLLVTNLHVYYRLYSKRNTNKIKKGDFPLNEINNIYINIGRKGSDLIINNKKEAFMTAYGVDGFKKTEGEIINTLFEIIIKSIN